MTGPERVRAELDVLGLDASAHVVDFYAPMLDALGVTRSRDLLAAAQPVEVWVAGVKVATQTPPIRSGRRVVFLTLDDSTGPVDATFFEDVQGPYAATVFHSWLLLVRGVVRRTGPRGISLRATGAWELTAAVGGVAGRWPRGGVCRDGRQRARPPPSRREALEAAAPASRCRQGAGCSCTPRGSGSRPTPTPGRRGGRAGVAPARPGGGGARRAGTEQLTPPRKLWHSSPGSSGH